MSRILLALTGIALCATLPSAAADDAASFQTGQVKQLHAAVTDMPEVVDMSYADPKAWHSLPSAAQVHDNERTFGSAVELHALRTIQQRTLGPTVRPF